MVKDIQKYRLILESSGLSKRERVERLFKEYFRSDYDPEISEDGIVYVPGFVSYQPSLGRPDLLKLPIQFKSTDGFSCHKSTITSLIGCPINCNGYLRCTECPNLISLEGLPKYIKGTVYLDFNPELPLLQLVTSCRIVNVMDNNDITRIMNKYCNHSATRKDIIACQKELIDAGYEGNAKW